MKIIVGLGNPGRDYARTRHNIGFMVVDELARRLSASGHRSRFRAELQEAQAEGEKVLLVKPQTYMNLSGISVREAVRWYKTAASDLLIIADDIDLPFGTLRLRASGGSGGHNGLKSIFAEMGAQDLCRLRIGVGRGQGDATRQVLARFSAEETRILPEIVRAAADCALAWEHHGVVVAMNRCNRRPELAPTTESSTESPTASATRTGQTENTNSGSRGRTDQAHSPTSGLVGAFNRVRSLWKKDED